MEQRVVFDSNIFLSARLGQGASHHVLAAYLRGCCRLLMGAARFAGYEIVLGRTELLKRAG